MNESERIDPIPIGVCLCKVCDKDNRVGTAFLSTITTGKQSKMMHQGTDGVIRMIRMATKGYFTIGRAIIA